MTIGYKPGSHFQPRDWKTDRDFHRGRDIPNYCVCGAEYFEHWNGECPIDDDEPDNQGDRDV